MLLSYVNIVVVVLALIYILLNLSCLLYNIHTLFCHSYIEYRFMLSQKQHYLRAYTFNLG
jgi:hypothetical protein